MIAPSATLIHNAILCIKISIIITGKVASHKDYLLKDDVVTTVWTRLKCKEY